MTDRETLIRIGDALRRRYDDIVTAPLPAEWLALLAKLDGPLSGPVTV